MLPQILQFLIFAIILPSLRALTGDHVCQRVENYTVTWKETYMVPVTIQTVSWCLKIPPRCSKSRTEMRERYRIKSQVKFRRINECCEGYETKEIDEDATCVPVCEDCLNGLCVSPNNCQCDLGYQGKNCAYGPASTCVPEHLQNVPTFLSVRTCSSKGTCDPVYGICRCHPGWRGIRCEDKCAPGRWGQDCGTNCMCKGPLAICDPETGECLDDKVLANDGESVAQNWTKEKKEEESFQVSHVLSVTQEPSTTNSTERTTGSTLSDQDWIDEDYKFIGFVKTFKTTERYEENLDANFATTDASMDLENVQISTPSYFEERTQNRDDFSTTQKFVDVSAVDRSLVEDEGVQNLDPSTMNLSLDDENSGNTVTPKTDYVKTIHKEDTSAISFDVTVLIVVGSIVSLCLTSIAVLMIFHMRSRLFETVRLSIYNDDKNDGCQEKENAGKMPKIVNNGTLPQPLMFPNSVYSANQDGTFITFDGAELSNKNYANRTATISIRLSDLLESHYDRPPAATCCHTIDTNMEHVYDEIPGSTPFSIRKET